MVYGREALLRDARRGVGKTSLLRTIENDARSLGFDTCWITAGDGSFLSALVEALDTLSRDWQDAAREQLGRVLHNLFVRREADHAAGG